MATIPLDARRAVLMRQRIVSRDSLPIRRELSRLYRRLADEVFRSLGLRRPRVQKDARLQSLTFAFDFEAWSKVYASRLSALTGAVYGKHLQDKESGIGIGLVTNTKDTLTADYIEASKINLAGFASADAQRVKSAISRFILEGKTGNDLSEAVADMFDRISTGRADIIARHEAGKAYSKSRADFWDHAAPGVQKKKRWLPSIGGRHDRVHHNAIPHLNGDIDEHELFRWRNPQGISYSAPYPQADTLPIEESINCKCDFRYIFAKSALTQLDARELLQQA